MSVDNLPWHVQKQVADWTGLSTQEVGRRLTLCPDCLQYDSYHDSYCNNEERDI